MKSKGKILFVLMLIGILYFCFGLRTVEAKQLTTPLYFGINEIRTLSSPNMGYAIGNPNANGSEAKGIKLWNILKYSTSTSNDPTEVDVYCVKAGVGFSNTYRRATYNFSFDMYKERDEIAAKSTTLNGLVNGGHYNELLALANILYLAEDETEDLEAYLNRAGIYAQYWDSLLTVDEVKSVQQAAIWYFTNYGEEEFDKTAVSDSGWLNYTLDGNTYTSLGDYQLTPNRIGYQRQMQAEQLYKYLINTAKANSDNYSDPNKNYKTKLTLYTAQGTNGEEQPLMEIEREKQFDLSLRKYITKVNGTNVSVSRVPEIDVTNLENGSDTTATYNHKKDPVLVENGDVVTYNIQVYNEGDVDGYVNKIVDQLPTGLKFSRLITSGYTASYDSSNNVVTITRDESNNDRLVAFDGSNLDSTTLELECIVDTTEGDKVLTNVAWIAEEETIDGNIITSEVGDDRDSEPDTKPDVNKDNMEDYKGNDSNQSDLTDTNYFYKGQQDDDDFEKLITKKIEGSYNLQIVKVDKDNTQTKLQGAEFKVTLPDSSIVTKTTDSNGVIDLGKIDITETGTDTIKVEELNAPNGYNKVFNSFELDVTKEQQNGAYVATNVDLKNSQGSGLGTGTGKIQVNNQNGMITITVPNEKIQGSYDLQIVKVDKDNEQTKLQGAEFKITMPDGNIVTKTTDSNGVIDLDEVEITETGTDTIKVEELNAPSGYNKLFNSFELDVTKQEQNGVYVVTNVNLKNSQESGLGTGQIQVNNQNGMITITVPNEKIEGSYDLQVVKIDQENSEKLQGAEFKVTMPDGSERTETTGADGTLTIEGIEITETGIDTIKVEELNAPNGYNKLFNSFELDVTKGQQNGAYVVTDIDLKNTEGSGLGAGKIQASYQENLVTVTVPNIKKEGKYDLQIVKVDKADTETKLQGAEFKVTMPDGSVVTKTTDENGVIDLDEVEITGTGTDKIKVEELNAPTGYNKLFNSFELDVTKEEKSGAYVVTKVDLKNGQGSGLGQGEVQVSYQDGMITITVPNEKTEGSYDLQILKVDKNNPQTKLQGAEFKITLPDGSDRTETTGEDGTLTIEGIEITEAGIDTIKVEELNAPNGYNKLFNSFELDVTKEEKSGAYVVTNIDLKNSQGSGLGSGQIQSNYQEGLVTITVPNEKTEGNYDLKIVKVDKDNSTRLQGAKFKITMPDGSEVTKTTDENGIIDLDSVEIIETGIDTIKVEELNAPSGYNKLFNSFELDVTKQEQNGAYIVTRVDLKNAQGSGQGEVKVNNQDGIITITVPNVKKEFDLSLRKFIIAVSSDENIEDGEYLKNRDGSYTREPVVDTSLLNTLDSTGNKITTAIYNHTKEPVTVKRNDYVVYMLRVYNEGEINGYASEIKDHLPPYLEFVDNEFNKGYGWSVSEDGRTVTTRYLENSLIKAAEEGENGYTLSYVDVPIMCKVVEGAVAGENITNIADITEYQDEDRNPADDRDSEEDNVELPEDEELPGYKDDEKGEYVPGQEDDDDFEKVIVEEDEYFDLSLRKFIVAVSSDENIEDGEYLRNENGSYTREPVVDTSLLNTISTNGSKITTAIYNHTKEPVTVKRNDYVVYMLRIYNEGDIDGYASEIKDHLPPYLEFVDNEFNKGYGWSVSEDGRTVTTRYLENSLIKAAEEGENGYTLSYVDVPIMCKVTDSAISGENITNIADITEYQDEDRNPADDRDSEEDNVELPEDEELPGYKDEESGDYIPGQEDDDDFEKVIIEEEHFDLALRKFITKVDEESITTRIPEVSYNASTGKITYNHTKEPVKVETNNIVTYTIRIYNEGDINGYANVILDDIPDGLEFLPDNETNINYRWVMYDEEGNVAENVEEAVSIRTDYLSKEQEENPGDNLLLAFNPDEAISEINPSYKDVQVAFKVVEPNNSDRVLVNSAQISDDSDEDGNEVEDEDSTPDEWNEGEDDQDKEYVELLDFDLSLRKFIVAVSSDEDISDDEYLTNADGSYTREPVVDTSLLNTTDSNGNKITTAIYNHTKEPVSVKRNDYVVYMLRVYNEGDIDGYASEIKDHLPPYLEFVDNEFNKGYGWSVSEDGRTVTTRYLENNLIKAAEEGENGYTLSYVDVPIMCKVTDSAISGENITNIADITEYQDEDRNPADDRDSEEDNVELPEDEELPGYKDEESGDYIPGQEDDDDFEKVIVEEEHFDLALRKFITKVDDKDITSRIPEVNYDEDTEEISYNHTKEPVLVVTDNIVTYTIRIYNEGDINGYANVISDDIPDGLEFLPDNETNINYRWVMYDEEGNITENVEEAVSIRTDYLSKEQEENPGDNLLLAFNPDEPISETNPSYKDVQVAFKVVEPNDSDRVLVNSAQISDDSDEDGNEVEDEDSIPDEWNDGEDDQDKEYVKLVYFDLSLRKWVTQAIVIDKDGNQAITETGHQPYDEPEQIVKVDLYRKSIYDLTVKFRYKIRVTNEGEIAGYAKEITDYVPEGLRFLPEDNPGWTDEGNNVISTRLLENTLLQPGEYAEVEVVLTWINDENNMGLKENTAEISEDYNEYGAPDRDSTPDNKVDGEDDIDDAPVLLSVSTGQVRIYFTLGFVILITIASGVVLIKRFVL